MSEAIAVALITGAVALFGSILTIIATSRKQTSEMEKQIAVVTTKMDDMKEDIKSHNSYAKLFNENIPAIKQHMADSDRRLEALERKVS